ncbi:MAG: hypothetical protein Q4D21_03670 [Phascolarctobacterium sp.]|nr:hypothetical protein [Phascolarctobacterium sp.]
MQVTPVGDDLQILLTAGIVHIGAVALAMPCPPTNEGVTASVSVLTVPGHRDDIPASRVALAICKVVGRPIAVSAGLHLDGASKEEINILLKNSETLVQNFLIALQERK